MMKTLLKNLCCLIAAGGLLCGCGKDNGPRLAQLEKRLAELELAQSNTAARGEAVLDLFEKANSNLTVMVDQMLRQGATESALIAAAQNAPAVPATNNFRQLDPETGLPYGSKPVEPALFPVSAKVTESNNVWWKWSYQFAIGNPNKWPVKKSVAVSFYDAQGYKIATHRDRDLVVPALRTNRFSGFEMLDVPVAGTVKTVQAEFFE